MDISLRTRRDAETSTASTKSTDSDSDVHPLLAQFFDKAGDAMVLQGKVEDLDARQAERLAQRELLRDQDALLPTTDEDIVEDYHDGRAILLARLQVVRLEAKTLRSECERHALDIDEAKWRKSNLATFGVLYSNNSLSGSTGEASFNSTWESPASQRRVHTGTVSESSPNAPQHDTSSDVVSRSERSGLHSLSQSAVASAASVTKSGSRREVAPVDDERLMNVETQAVLGSESPNRRQDYEQILPQQADCMIGKPSGNRHLPIARHAHPSRASAASKSTPVLLLSSSVQREHYLASSSTRSQSLSDPHKVRPRLSIPEMGTKRERQLVNISIASSSSAHIPVPGKTLSSRSHTSPLYKQTEPMTDPELRSAYGVSARKFIVGTPHEAEPLDSSFRVPSRPTKFFRPGKVFSILWAESYAGSDGTEITDYKQIPPGFDAKVQRFVVIRAMEHYCSTIPITTNNGQGASSSGVKKSDFAVIHTSKTPPDVLSAEHPRRGEQGMRSVSIRIDPDDRTYRLDPLSRVNFGKVYTVEYTVKVKSFGMVNRASMRNLLYQFRDVWQTAFISSKPMALPRTILTIADATEALTDSVTPSTPQLETGPTAFDGADPNNRHKRSPGQLSRQKSLNDDASIAVDELLSHGHSVDQILSALGDKSLGGSQIAGINFGDWF